MRGATSPVEGQPERTPKRNRIMPAPTKFVSVGELPTSTTKNKKSTKKSTTKKSTKPVQVRPQPRVSDETRERLYQEALAYRGCEGMAPEDVRQWVDERLEAYLSKQPFWFGHTQKADVPHRAAHAQFRREREADKGVVSDDKAKDKGKCLCPWCTGQLPRSSEATDPRKGESE